MPPPAASPVPAPEPVILPERAGDRARVDALVSAAFGPGRYAKTAERLREGARPRADLSLVALAGRELVGAVRVWPVLIGADPALFLGPIAVDPAFRKHGLGSMLVQEVCARAASAGEAAILLVGDRPFFGPLGFQPVPPGRIVMPGPVDPARVLWKGLNGREIALAGPVSIAPVSR